MIRLLLIRHGDTQLLSHVLCGRMPGVHLSEKGREQARVLGRELASVSDLKAVYCSPLERTRETAAAVAEPHAIPVTLDNQLIEIDFGNWTGLPFRDIQSSDDPDKAESWNAFNRFRSMAAAPGGENMLEVQNRAWNAVTKILNTHPEGSVALVSHGDVIRSLLLYVLGMPLDHIFRIEVAPASLSQVTVGIGLAPVVHSINERYRG